MVLYSAAFGEQARRRRRRTLGRNSLFTEVLRSELPRPGQTVRELANRVKLMVRAIALDYGAQQEPEFVGPEDQRRLPMTSCWSARSAASASASSRERLRRRRADWDQIKNLRKRELLERHRRRFDGCATAELARREIARLALSSDDPIEPPTIVANRGSQRLRPARGLGSRFRAAAGGPRRRVREDRRRRGDRGLHQGGRGQSAHRALSCSISGAPITSWASTRRDRRASATRALRSARLAYDDASKRGYVSALNNLAVLYEAGDGVERTTADCDRPAQARRRAGPSARDVQSRPCTIAHGSRRQARPWTGLRVLFAKAAEAGFVSAMVELGDALVHGLRGVRKSAPRRRMAAARGGCRFATAPSSASAPSTYSVRSTTRAVRAASTRSASDVPLALLWIGRIADSGDSDGLVLARADHAGRHRYLQRAARDRRALLAARGLRRQLLCAGHVSPTGCAAASCW